MFCNNFLFYFFFGDEGQQAEPLLCKFADGGPKKNKHQHKFINGVGRVWRDDGMQYSFDGATTMPNG